MWVMSVSRGALSKEGSKCALLDPWLKKLSQIEPSTSMSRLQFFSCSLRFALSWCLSCWLLATWCSIFFFLFLRHNFVEIDPAALVITNTTFKISQLSIRQILSLDIGWTSIFKTLVYWVHKPYGWILKWIFACSEELSVLVKRIPVSLQLCILILSLLYLSFHCRNFFFSWFFFFVGGTFSTWFGFSSISWFLAFICLSCVFFFFS